MLTALGVALLALGTALLGYSAFADLAGANNARCSPLWRRPLVLVPLALASMLIGALLLREP